MNRPNLFKWVATAVVAASCLHAHAQQFPARTVTVVAPFPPGGSTDQQIRLMAERLSRRWGQSVVIENVAGAGGAVAAAQVAKARPDGYTLFFVSHPILSINPHLYAKLPYDAVGDFAPVVRATYTSNVLTVNAQSPYRSVRDLVAAASANPGKFNYGSGGVGTATHLAAALFADSARVNLTHVPYRGNVPAATALMADEIQVHFDTAATATANVRGGRLRALAVTAPKRLPGLPDVPTLDESGLPGFESSPAYGIVVPAGTPVIVIEALNRDFNAVLGEPDLKKQLADQGITVVGGTPEEFGRFLATERTKWGSLIKRLDIRAE